MSGLLGSPLNKNCLNVFPLLKTRLTPSLASCLRRESDGPLTYGMQIVSHLFSASLFLSVFQGSYVKVIRSTSFGRYPFAMKALLSNIFSFSRGSPSYGSVQHTFNDSQLFNPRSVWRERRIFQSVWFFSVYPSWQSKRLPTKVQINKWKPSFLFNLYSPFYSGVATIEII